MVDKVKLEEKMIEVGPLLLGLTLIAGLVATPFVSEAWGYVIVSGMLILMAAFVQVDGRLRDRSAQRKGWARDQFGYYPVRYSRRASGKPCSQEQVEAHIAGVLDAARKGKRGAQ